MPWIRLGRWLESYLLPLGAALVWVTWLAPLLHYLLNGGLAFPAGVRYPAWLILALLVGAGALRRLVEGRRLGGALGTVAGLLAVLGVVAYLFRVDPTAPLPWLGRTLVDLTAPASGYPAPLLAFVATALIWLWGSAVSWDDYGQLFAGFLLGVVAYGVLLLVPDASFWERTGQSIWTYLLGFIATGLLILGILSVRHMLAREGAIAGRAARPGREWALVVAIVVVAVFLVGWLGASFLAPESVAEVLRLLRPLGRALEWLLLRALWAVAYVIFGLLDPLIRLAQGLVARNWESISERLGEMLDLLSRLAVERPQEPSPAEAGPGVLRGFRIALVALLVTGAAVALYLVHRRRARGAREGEGDVRESVLSRELLEGQLGALLAGLRRPPPPAPYLPVGGEDPREAIRLLYQAFLAAMSRLGRARPAHLTPRAYARRLAEARIADADALTALTEAYLVARYAPDPPTGADVAAARDALARLGTRAPGDRGAG